MKVKNFFPWVSHAVIYSEDTATVWNLCVIFYTPIIFATAKHLKMTHDLFLDALDTHENELFSILSYKQFATFAYQIKNLEIISLLVLTLFTAKSYWGECLF